ncbi:MAG: DUF3606 domain-containing protein [Burkholderiales bacterium]
MDDSSLAGLEPRIDPQRIMSLVYWGARFKRAPEDVEAAVAAVGSRAEDVAAWLGQRMQTEGTGRRGA